MAESAKIFILTLVVTGISATYDCGRSNVIGRVDNLRITDTKPGQWPWVAGIIHRNGDVYYCGATVISTKHLLSAAYCFQRKTFNLTADNLYAIIGRHKLSNNNDRNSVIRNISELIIHENYNATFEAFKSDFDIAIIKLNKSVEFTNFIRPACLPPMDRNLDTGIITGYGKNLPEGEYRDTPQHVLLDFLSEEVCIYVKFTFARVVSLRSFCGGNVTELPCLADTGSGFVSLNNRTGRLAVYGVASQSLNPRNCRTGDHVVLADVTKYVDWIVEKVTSCKKDDLGCIKPCDVISCGLNAECVGGTCKCINNFEGDPFVGCTPRFNPCLTTPSMCGPNSKCQFGEFVTCSCIIEGLGSPPNCRKNECLDDNDCSYLQICSSNGTCINPCQLNRCGKNSVCVPNGRSYSCQCPSGYFSDLNGDCTPISRFILPPRDPCEDTSCGNFGFCSTENGAAECFCMPEYGGNFPDCYLPTCNIHSHCLDSEICTLDGRCVGVCDDACQRYEKCVVLGDHRHTCESLTTTTTTSTARTTTTTVSVATLPIVPCHPNPCGDTASCHNENGYAICRCYYGHYPNCRKNECNNHNHCLDHQKCHSQRCVHVCDGKCQLYEKCVVLGDHHHTCESLTTTKTRTTTSRTTTTSAVSVVTLPPDPCHPSYNTCGDAASCQNENGFATCRCYYGLFPNCRKNECINDDHCLEYQKCHFKSRRCVHVCKEKCFRNEKCVVLGEHRHTCESLTTTTTATTTTSAVSVVTLPPDPCHPSYNTCGDAASCQIENGFANCYCYYGHFPNCRRNECNNDDHCFEHQKCHSKSLQCVHVCKGRCLSDERCEAAGNHGYRCKAYKMNLSFNDLLKGLLASARYLIITSTFEYRQCHTNDQCTEREICSTNNICVNPCSNFYCGQNSKCVTTGRHNYGCACFKGYERDQNEVCQPKSYTGDDVNYHIN